MKCGSSEYLPINFRGKNCFPRSLDTFVLDHNRCPPEHCSDSIAVGQLIWSLPAMQHLRTALETARIASGKRQIL